MSRQVVGVYNSTEEAVRVVDSLRDRGFAKNDIHLIANEAVVREIPFDNNVSVEDNNADNETSLWEQIKGAFTVSDDDSQREHSDDPFYGYENEVRDGSIVVLVDSEEEIDAASLSAGGTAVNADNNGARDPRNTPYADNTRADYDRDVNETRANRNTTDADQKVSLSEDQLNVTKDEVEAGEVNISKHEVEETETVEVPVSHEEIVIERKPVTDGRVSDDSANNLDKDEEIHIPISEEKVNVDKERVVTEEVDISKKEVTEDKTISENISHEELDIDAEGDTRVTDNRRDQEDNKRN